MLVKNSIWWLSKPSLGLKKTNPPTFLSFCLSVWERSDSVVTDHKHSCFSSSCPEFKWKKTSIFLVSVKICLPYFLQVVSFFLFFALFAWSCTAEGSIKCLPVELDYICTRGWVLCWSESCDLGARLALLFPRRYHRSIPPSSLPRVTLASPLDALCRWLWGWRQLLVLQKLFVVKQKVPVWRQRKVRCLKTHKHGRLRSVRSKLSSRA